LSLLISAKRNQSRHDVFQTWGWFVIKNKYNFFRRIVKVFDGFFNGFQINFFTDGNDSGPVGFQRGLCNVWLVGRNNFLNFSSVHFYYNKNNFYSSLIIQSMPRKATFEKLPTFQVTQALVTIDTAIHTTLLEKIQKMNQAVLDKLVFLKDTDMVESIIYELKETAIDLQERVYKLEDTVQKLASGITKDHWDEFWTCEDGQKKRKRQGFKKTTDEVKIVEDPAPSEPSSDDDE
jgi:hypothetical protein